MRAQLSDTGLVPERRRLPEISKGKVIWKMHVACVHHSAENAR